MRVISNHHDFDYSWEEVTTANWRKYGPDNKESGHVLAVDVLSRSIDPSTGILRTERLITVKQSAPKWLLTVLGGDTTAHVYEISYVTPPYVNSFRSTASNLANTPTSSSTIKTPLANTTSQRRKMFSRTPQPAQSQPQAQSQVQPSSSQSPTVGSSPKEQPPSLRMTSYNLSLANLLRVRESVVYSRCPLDPAHMTRFEQQASITAFCGGWSKIREKIEAFSVERFGQNAEKGRRGFEHVLELSRRVWREEREREAQAGLRAAAGR